MSEEAAGRVLLPTCPNICNICLSMTSGMFLCCVLTSTTNECLHPLTYSLIPNSDSNECHEWLHDLSSFHLCTDQKPSQGHFIGMDREGPACLLADISSSSSPICPMCSLHQSLTFDWASLSSAQIQLGSQGRAWQSLYQGVSMHLSGVY